MACLSAHCSYCNNIWFSNTPKELLFCPKCNTENNTADHDEFGRFSLNNYRKAEGVNKMEISAELTNIFEEKGVNKDELLKMADALVEIRKNREIAENKAKDFKAEEEILIENLSTQMIAQGLKSINRDDGIKLISVITPAFYVKADKKQDLLAALKQYGDGGLIKEDVPYQTMNAFFKMLEEQIKDQNSSEETKATAKATYQQYVDLVEKVERKGIQIRGLKNKIDKE